MNKEIRDQEAKIRLWNHYYYDLHNPLVSDETFDWEYEKLKNLNPDSPALIEKGQEYDQDFKHNTPMGSLRKCKTIDELFDKFKGQEVTISAKIDGASLANHFHNGLMAISVTRGNSITQKGKVVTSNAKHIKCIPQKLPSDFNFEVRGEVFIYNDDWEKLSGKEFTNPRNTASGSLGLKDPAEVSNRLVSFCAFKVIDSPFPTHSQTLEWLSENGFTVPQYETVTIETTDQLKELINKWDQKRKTFKYQTDGIVIRVNNEHMFDEMGLTSNCWNGALAYKFETEKAETVITDIEWEVGRMGFVTPVAIFNEIILGEAVITRCTLNNPQWMKENGCPSIGSKILVEKGGDIIPCLSSVLEKGTGNTKQPTHCPSCGTELISNTIAEGKKGSKLFCINGRNCPPQYLNMLLNMLRKFEIKGIAESSLQKLIDCNLIKEPWDIFDVDFYDLCCAGFSLKQSDNIRNALKNIVADPVKLLASLGIEGWGVRMFEKLRESGHYTDQQLLQGNFNYEQLISVPGIGHIRALTLSHIFRENAYGHKFIHEMTKRLKIAEQDIIQTPITGKTFLITGTLSKPRSQIESNIKNSGGKILSGVSKKLNYLIVGDNPGGKLKKAVSMNIDIINEKQLEELMCTEN